ncbi:MAG: hypothetical protein ACTHU0_30715 [Kofleriaceae bacterium]
MPEPSIDSAIITHRLDAAQAEWERHDRVRRVLRHSVLEARSRLAHVLDPSTRESETIDLALREAFALLDGVAEAMDGTWILSPAARAALQGEAACPT